jgi:hypothetical protein
MGSESIEFPGASLKGGRRKGGRRFLTSSSEAKASRVSTLAQKKGSVVVNLEAQK